MGQPEQGAADGGLEGEEDLRVLALDNVPVGGGIENGGEPFVLLGDIGAPGPDLHQTEGLGPLHGLPDHAAADLVFLCGLHLREDLAAGPVNAPDHVLHQLPEDHIGALPLLVLPEPAAALAAADEPVAEGALPGLDIQGQLFRGGVPGRGNPQLMGQVHRRPVRRGHGGAVLGGQGPAEEIVGQGEDQLQWEVPVTGVPLVLLLHRRPAHLGQIHGLPVHGSPEQRLQALRRGKEKAPWISCCCTPQTPASRSGTPSGSGSSWGLKRSPSGTAPPPGWPGLTW